MAKVTCLGLTYAKYASGGAGSAVTYTGGKAKDDYLCKVDQGEERGNVDEFADGHKIDKEQTMTGGTVDFEIANEDEDILVDLLGQIKDSTSSELALTDADPPYVGVGFILGDRYKGSVTYDVWWYWKVQFTKANQSVETRKENTDFQHETLNGSAVAVQVASDNVNHFATHKKGLTLTAARTWLNGKAGIT